MLLNENQPLNNAEIIECTHFWTLTQSYPTEVLQFRPRRASAQKTVRHSRLVLQQRVRKLLSRVLIEPVGGQVQRRYRPIGVKAPAHAAHRNVSTCIQSRKRKAKQADGLAAAAVGEESLSKHRRMA